MATARMAAAKAEKFAMCAERHLQDLQETLERNTIGKGLIWLSGPEAVQAEKNMKNVRARLAELEGLRKETRDLCLEKVREQASGGYAADQTLCHPEPPPPPPEGGGLMGKMKRLAYEASLGCSDYDSHYKARSPLGL